MRLDTYLNTPENIAQRLDYGREAVKIIENTRILILNPVFRSLHDLCRILLLAENSLARYGYYLTDKHTIHWFNLMDSMIMSGEYSEVAMREYVNGYFAPVMAEINKWGEVVL